MNEQLASNRIIYHKLIKYRTKCTDHAPPGVILEILQTLLFNIDANPVDALINANYIGILTWAIVLGIALRHATESTKDMIANFSDAISQIVKWVINLAPIGIMGLVYDAISTNGLSALLDYGKLLIVLTRMYVLCGSCY